ncbi:MAG: hypothetical protein ACR65U_14225 [Methylocystis sp.]
MVHDPRLQDILGEVDDVIPQRARPQLDAAGVINDLPIEAAQWLIKARIGQRSIELKRTIGNYRNVRRKLSDISIEFDPDATDHVTLKDANQPRAGNKKGDNQRYGRRNKETQP